MDALKEEIARKKRKLMEEKAAAGAAKYAKRADMEQLKAANDPANITAAADATHGTGTKSGAAVSEEDAAAGSALSSKKMLPTAEIIRRLREREEPIRLFGETDVERWERLRQLEISQPEVNHGLRNDYKDALDMVKQEQMDKLLKRTDESHSDLQKKIISAEEEGRQLDALIAKSRERRSSKERSDIAECDFMVSFLQFVLAVKESTILSRSDEEKRTSEYNHEFATHKQTCEYMKPLIRMLKKRVITDHMRNLFLEMCDYCLDREYVKANDAYLRLSIGTQAWPLGATSVGIHSRPGREKISEKNQHGAHALSSEESRKFITGMKRLMTFCQRRYVADPSKCVDFERSS